MPASEETIASWVFRHGRKAGLGVDDLLKARALYVPLRGAQRTIGVMAVIAPSAGVLQEHERLIDVFANQTALGNGTHPESQRRPNIQAADANRTNAQLPAQRRFA